MARFPKREEDILTLAQAIIDGLAGNPGVFPNPPVGGSALVALLNEVLADIADYTATIAEAEAFTSEKDRRLEVLEQAMKDDLSYAEVAVAGNDDKLKKLGWSARKGAMKPVKPGQVLRLRVVSQGVGHLLLDWEAPLNGGIATEYLIRRRVQGEEVWVVAGLAIGTGKNLEGQPRGVSLEYCVVARNTAGEGMESNFVLAVL